MLREEVKCLLKTTGVLNSLLHSLMHLSLKLESIVFSIKIHTIVLQKKISKWHLFNSSKMIKHMIVNQCPSDVWSYSLFIQN